MPKYKEYRESDLEEALRMVEDGASANSAAKACNVPKSTILWRIKHPIKQKAGRKTKIGMDDEKELVNYAEFMSDNGTPITSKWLRETGTRMATLR